MAGCWNERRFQELWADYRHGNGRSADAIEKIVTDFFQPLAAVLSAKKLPPGDDRDDLEADMIARAWQYRNNYRPESGSKGHSYFCGVMASRDSERRVIHAKGCETISRNMDTYDQRTRHVSFTIEKAQHASEELKRVEIFNGYK